MSSVAKQQAKPPAAQEAKELKSLERSATKVAIDIGSTVVKIAHVDSDDNVISQRYVPRDYEGGIARQVHGLLDELDAPHHDQVLICSSANGGLRIGIVCLSRNFTGTTLRNQALLAGANPLFVHTFEEYEAAPYVDILLVGGGIDCEDAGPLSQRLEAFDAGRYRFGALAYVGNRYMAESFVKRHPKAIVIANPLADSLAAKSSTAFEAIRSAYLEDLVYKEGISELRRELAHGVRPTPEVVSRGFLRALTNRSSLKIGGACILLDIGGATTDFHYTVEIVRADSEALPPEGFSIGRYVFTDLGVFASLDSTMMQLRAHPRLFEFLASVGEEDVRETYRLVREGEYRATPEMLAYACVFLSLDRFAHGRGPGLPTADLNKVAQLILSGGASQPLSEAIVSRIVALFVSGSTPEILIDRKYRVWVDGITWPITA